MVIHVDKRKNTVYLSLGTNLGNRGENLKKAMKLLEERVGPVVDQSSVYETEGWGSDRLAFFYNSVVLLESCLSPLEVLEQTQTIEKLLGRKKKTVEIYENRLIDIDILFFNDRVLKTERLSIPHPSMVFRKFVLKPLCEVSPHFIHPTLKKRVKELYKNLDDNSKCIKLS